MPEKPMTDDEQAAHGLRIALAQLTGDLHDAIDNGMDAEVLHNIVGLWEANKVYECTYEGWVALGTPLVCDDCQIDLQPRDEEGFAVEGWEFFMVEHEVWKAATDGPEPMYLCVEKRIGRALSPNDFMDVPFNEPHELDSSRLKAAEATSR